MGTPYAMILRLRITPDALRHGLNSACPSFDSYDDWDRLPIMLDDDLRRSARENDRSTPGGYLAEVAQYSSKEAGWMFDYNLAQTQLVCMDLLHPDSWSTLMYTVTRLRGLAASEGYLIIQDLIGGSMETQAAIGFHAGTSRVLDIDAGEADALIANADAVAMPWLAALQQAGEGPRPIMPNQLGDWLTK